MKLTHIEKQSAVGGIAREIEHTRKTVSTRWDPKTQTDIIAYVGHLQWISLQQMAAEIPEIVITPEQVTMLGAWIVPVHITNYLHVVSR